MSFLFEMQQAVFKRETLKLKDNIISRNIDNVAEDEMLEMKHFQITLPFSSPALYETTVSHSITTLVIGNILLTQQYHDSKNTQYHMIRKLTGAGTAMVSLLGATRVSAPFSCPCEPDAVLADQLPCSGSRQLEELGWLCLPVS